MKILTVDFDIIMAPCIKLYNNMCAGNANSTELWNSIESRIEVDKFLCYDYNTLHSIAMLMKKSVNNGAEFIKIDEHDKIISKLIPRYNDEKFDITNIDFHHDIAYNKDSINDIKNFDNHTCGNWVAYLHLKEYLDKYTWVKASNSDMCDPEIKSAIGIEYDIINKRDIDKIEPVFDQIYFCLSPQWVPYKYHHLYDLIADMVEV